MSKLVYEKPVADVIFFDNESVRMLEMLSNDKAEWENNGLPSQENPNL